jgi:vancomycin permeability regulator SanA
VRAKEVFGQNEICIVSQRDHAARAVYLADHFGISAIGAIAPDVGFRSGLRTRIREVFARVRAVLDVTVLSRKPRFLGPKVEIPDGSDKATQPAQDGAGGSTVADRASWSRVAVSLGHNSRHEQPITFSS